MTWVVKLGGSLNADPLLPQWLDVLTQLGGGRVVLVCGGGSFADTVRAHQAHWRYHDLAAHNMALLAMAQTAHFLHALNPALQLVGSDADAQRALRLGKTALWTPLALLTDQADAGTNWSVTSDSLALALAQRLGAEQLVLVKSCAIDPAASLAELAKAGVVDARFESLAGQGNVPVRLLQNDQAQRMRSLLLGEVEAGDAAP
ncbi:MAG: aspartate kinase [Methylibium sp. NZG]|nr:MAG: aspartate kinase [Methylibium sp. NZG]